MVRVIATNEQKNLYIRFLYLLNNCGGTLQENDGRVYDFLII